MEYDPELSVREHPDVYPPSEDSIFLIECLDVSPGERVAQLVITPVFTPEVCEVTELSDTERGEGGFGSTGQI